MLSKHIKKIEPIIEELKGKRKNITRYRKIKNYFIKFKKEKIVYGKR